MHYFILAFFVLLAFFFFYKIVMPLSEPDFKLKGQLSEQKLYEKMRELALHSRKVSERGKGLSLRLIKKYIEKAYKNIAVKIRNKEECFEFENWIYDNYYKFSESLALLKKELNKFYFLPHGEELPRVYDFAQLLVKSCEGCLTEELIKGSAESYNNETPMNHGEVMALKSAVEFALLEFIAIFCSKSLTIDKMIKHGKSDVKKQKVDLTLLRYNSYVYSLYRYGSETLRRSLSPLCLENGIDLNARVESFNVLTAHYNGQMQSCVTTLHKLVKIFTDDFIIRLSPVFELFNSERGITFKEADLATKFLYLENIYFKAKKKKISELAVARDSIEASRRKNTDISFEILPSAKSKKAAYLYIALYLLFTLALSFSVPLIFGKFYIPAALISMPVFFAMSGIILSNFINTVFKRRHLPSYDLKYLKRENYRTLIAVCRLVADKEEIRDSYRNLETIICANPDPVFSYCLLLDLPASGDENGNKTDAEILSEIESGYEENEQKERITVLVRRRKKIKDGTKFQGWEKKRGAIIELNRYLSGALTGDDFMLKKGGCDNIKYVLTLDSDTMTNSALSLVSLMEHPYNQDKNIISVNMNTNSSEANKTYFTRLFSGGVGLDNYSRYAADSEYDLFGSGNYTGKGIYRVKEFSQKLEGAFEDNRILSHDYIEGAYASCANSNETALDSFPLNFSQFLTRQLRWLRGDWQLLPYLKRKVRDGSGGKTVNPIMPINKWHIFSNMINSLVPVASMALLFLSLFFDFPLYVCAVSFLLPAVYLLLSIRTSVLMGRNLWAAELLRQTFWILTLPVVAYNHFKSVVITLYRLVKKTKLLEWKVFAHSSGRVNFVPTFISVIIFAATTAVFDKSIFFYVLCGLFLSAPLADRILSRALKEKRYENPQFNESLKDLLSSTYNYFTDNFKSEFNYLPCDNFQEDLSEPWIARTSPTNIGYALLSHACAFESGLITKEELDGICSKILASVEKLPKWKGNLFNWYDIKTRVPLEPQYVSSVDSGNFLACLTAIAHYLDKDLRGRVLKLIQDTNLAALFDIKRGLFRIGYTHSSGVFDESHYDLAGSEASLLYLISAAYGKTDRRAWNNLSRRTVSYGGGRMLYSWTGGMFEHLMCPLFFSYEKGTVYNLSAKAVVKAQRKYAAANKHSIFGISECQYDRRDDNGLFQYKAFGVPEIALSNNPGYDVAAPYASMLALSLEPQQTEKNYKNMLKLDLKGKYGLYESVDLSNGKIMKSYMTHHQGMVMASVCNYLNNGAIIKSCECSGGVRAAQLLLTQSQRIKGYKKIKLAGERKKNAPQSFTVSERTGTPYVNLLANGKFVSVQNSLGGGYSVYSGILLNRSVSRFDGAQIFAEIKNERVSLLSGGVCEFKSDASVYNVSKPEFSAITEIFLLPCGGEARESEFTNLTDKKIKVRFLTYTEPVLSERDADLSHRAYSNMFIETFYDGFHDYIYAKRNNKDNPLYFGHSISAGTKITYTTSRYNFFNKNSTMPDIGTPLDPVLSGSFEVEVKPKGKVKFTSFYFASSSPDALNAAVRISRTDGYCDRVRGTNFALACRADLSAAVKRTAAKLLYGASGTRKTKPLEYYSPRPIITLEIVNSEAVSRLKDKLNQLKKLYSFHIEFNLAIVFKEKHNYYLHLTEQINSALDELSFRKAMNAGSTLRLINSDISPEEAEYALNNGIKADTPYFDVIDENLPEKVKERFESEALEKRAVALKGGIGGFTADGGYYMDLSESAPPAPWSNIIANKNFGCIITHSGGGYTYLNNSRQNKITHWSNDPVLDPPSEFIVLGEKGLLWSVTEQPLPTQSGHTVFHAQGCSEFCNDFNGFSSCQRVFIDKELPVKYYELTLTNNGGERRTINAMFALNPVLGDFKTNTVSGLDAYKDGNSLVIVNRINNMRIFLSVNKAIESFSLYRESFTDRQRNITRNSGLKNSGSEFFPAVCVSAEIGSGGSEKIIFAIGTERIIGFDHVPAVLKEASGYYSALSAVEVVDGGADIFKYMNKWVPYQVLCSRFFARAGFYQAGGAIGFRDQLQDCLALLFVDPKLVRVHLLTCAAHQFEEGDVQHWWHPPATGVRTTISDDKLFLPLVTAEYVNFTQDYAVLCERAPYLENVKLKAGEASAYTEASNTSRGDTLYNHCLKAVYSAFDFAGNGLVKMRGGDWNDAMDKVGERGEGTSVWLTMFLYYVCDKFLPFVDKAEDREKIVTVTEKIKTALDKTYDGEWFVRAYTDDGYVLGSADSPECKIDLISQSFASLSGACKEDKAATALYSAEKILVDYDSGIIKLLTPPFKTMKNIGYISKYPQGVRENGGQYTHAAVWYVLSLIKAGKTEKAWELFNMITPYNHSLDVFSAQKYAVEPYVLAADVYGGQFSGRGGWSWYTGSASWYYKCLIEEFYGVKICGSKIVFEPHLPKSVRKISLRLRTGAGFADVEIDNTSQKGSWIAKVNSISYNSNEIEYSNALAGKKISVKRAD